MNEAELEGVLGHEVSHIANGDMVTMALLQGVVNTFVIFFARIAAFIVMQFFTRGESDNQNAIGGFAYYGVAILFEIFFGILASMIVMWFSRYREFRADSGSAKLGGRDKMIQSLRKLQMLVEAPRDKRGASFATYKITDGKRLMALFASHPPLEKRIEALQKSH
jgi:heat shock protein HtpX